MIGMLKNSEFVLECLVTSNLLLLVLLGMR